MMIYMIPFLVLVKTPNPLCLLSLALGEMEARKEREKILNFMLEYNILLFIFPKFLPEICQPHCH